MLICRDVAVRLAPFLQGELSLPDRLSIHQHLAGCPQCRRAVEQGRDALEISRSACAAAQDPRADDVPVQLVQAIWVACYAGR
jgi:anti-sigma factor RsiW